MAQDNKKEEYQNQTDGLREKMINVNNLSLQFGKKVLFDEDMIKSNRSFGITKLKNNINARLYFEA